MGRKRKKPKDGICLICGDKVIVHSIVCIRYPVQTSKHFCTSCVIDLIEKKPYVIDCFDYTSFSFDECLTLERKIDIGFNIIQGFENDL